MITGALEPKAPFADAIQCRSASGDLRQSIANSNPVRFIKLLIKMKFSFAGLLVGITLNALVSYGTVDAVLCMCHPNSCVLINANNTVLSTPERYCVINTVTIIDILILRYNETKLPVDILASFENLSSVEIFQGSLRHIEPGAFEKLVHLTKLDIRNNDVRTIDDYTFRGLEALQILELISNNLTSIAPNAFDGLKSLVRVALTSNHITQLPAKLFSSSPMLRSIIINNNQLTELPVGIFDNIQELIRLDVSNNRLKTFIFPDLNAVLLFLRNNNISSLYINDHAKFVHATQNRIKTIMGTGLRITDLVLTDNAITDIRPITRMTNLTKLGLSNNPLEPNSVFASLTKLQELLLSNTSIQISENTFANLSSLLLLDLSFNNLTQLEFWMFSSMSELESLIVAYNRLEQLNFIEMRANLPDLRVLEICGNGWNATYMQRTLDEMHRYRVRADMHGLSHSLLFSSLFVEMCSAEVFTKASLEYTDDSMENDKGLLDQEIEKFYPSTTTTTPIPVTTVKEKANLFQTSTTIKTTTGPKLNTVEEEPIVAVKLNPASASLPSAEVTPGEQQPVVGSSPLYITFQVLVYILSVFGVVCLVVLGYYARQRRFDVRRLTPVDNTDSVRLM